MNLEVNLKSERRIKAIVAFLCELSGVRSRFKWRVDEFGQIRGQHPEYYHEFDPITAMVLCGTNKYYRSGEAHKAAEELALREYSLEIVDACDNRKETPLRRGLLLALGLLEND